MTIATGHLSPHIQLHNPIHHFHRLHRTFDSTIILTMTSLIPSVRTSTMNQGASTGSYATPTTVQGLPEDLARLLSPEEMEQLTAEQTEDLIGYLGSEHFQTLLDEEFPNE
jgi:hypothetical protein